MTQAKHTPGPWHTGVRTAYAGRDVYGPLGELVAVADSALSDMATAQANARLIAAAPSMLSTLQGWLDTLKTVEQGTAWRDLPESVRSAVGLQKCLTEAAIAKAKQ